MGAVGNMRGVIVDEVVEQFVEELRRYRAPFGIEPARDHGARAVADEGSRFIERYRRDAFALEDEIERIHEVGRGFGEGAVEIENDGRERHSLSLAAAAARCKAEIRL